MDTLSKEILKPLTICNSFGSDSNKISTEIFKVLSSREFTYFTRIKSEPYKDVVCNKIVNLLNNKKRLTFYLNLGGGYHARTSGELSFEPGLSELLALFQVKKFICEISKIYPLGVNFEIIIDNRCAELANGISIIDTTRYCDEFAQMIKKLGLSDSIKLTLESNLINKEDFNNEIIALEKKFIPKISARDIQNTHRFCNSTSTSDVNILAEKYKIINKISREISLRYSQGGIHLTQRATESTFPFRSFPGGDSKIQCGKMALLLENGTIKKPFLITANNIEYYNLTKINLSEEFVIKNLLLGTLKKTPSRFY
jgi:hypothetical protein